MVQQANTYSFVNAQSYLDEISRPLNKSHENKHIGKQANMNNSHRAITQAQMHLFGNPAAQTESSMLQKEDMQILAVGAAPANNTSKVQIGGENVASQKSNKHKKSAKKVANALGSLSSASTAAVVGVPTGSLSIH